MSFAKVSPGDPWRPNAAKENALTDLLNRFAAGGDTVAPGAHYASSEYLKVCNVSDTEIKIGQAVQLDTAFVPEDTPEIGHRLHIRNVYACGKPVENEMGLWGVALSNIPPGEGGPVQIAGISIIRYPRGSYEITDVKGVKVRNNFLFPGKDGRYYFGRRGGAEVIWYDKHTSYALIRLGAADYQYTGMFAVLDNFDGTLTVKGGLTDLQPEYGTGISSAFGVSIEDTVIPVKNDIASVNLAASRGDGPAGWVLEIVQDSPRGGEAYIPGEKIVWALASYDGRDEYGYAINLQQLWQGGCVNFRDRYFIT